MDYKELISKKMKKYFILLVLFVFIALLTSSCMAGLSRDGSYGGDVSYRNGYDQGNHRGDRYRNHRDRNNRNDHRDRDDDNVLIIR
jgi:predicted small secreted protein